MFIHRKSHRVRVGRRVHRVPASGRHCWRWRLAALAGSGAICAAPAAATGAGQDDLSQWLAPSSRKESDTTRPEKQAAATGMAGFGSLSAGGLDQWLAPSSRPAPVGPGSPSGSPAAPASGASPGAPAMPSPDALPHTPPASGGDRVISGILQQDLGSWLAPDAAKRSPSEPGKAAEKIAVAPNEDLGKWLVPGAQENNPPEPGKTLDEIRAGLEKWVAPGSKPPVEPDPDKATQEYREGLDKWLAPSAKSGPPEAPPVVQPEAPPQAQPEAPPQAQPEAPPVVPPPAEPPAARPPAVPPARPAGDAVYLPGTRTLTPTANAALGAASAAQGLWQAEMNALSKRMGELRLTPAAGGVWGRAFTQRQKLDNRVAREFRQTISGFELGADTALPVADGRWHVGAVAGYTNGRIKFDRGGTGDDDSVHVGAYATYIEDGGFYMDGIVRVSRIRHAFKVDDAQGRRVRGRYRGNGVGASLELGKRFTWPSAWYVEPQLEVAAFHAQGADYTASNGLRIKDDGTNSMLGRVGLHVGRQFDLGDGRVVQPYMKLSWVQEFDGKGTVRTNDIRHKVRLDGGRTELAVGVASQLGKHGSLFGSYEYAKGSRQTMPWTFHVGYRYAW
ncbi:autotransporter outer membrane beta-barrel domain-containing protein [Bordetella bronchiseptica]|uniref:autotransporter outer membrane beta-barrel domain-containing protein n=1 Tax=Bordetella bronchiseptica TaxID=518 RepID=UPI00143E1907|nr:autotransporter outer membrane beta-barrel domain-containing protein [Bordetella bronchiseptica]QIY02621.1 autotransporter outer membrane beta-barrel domain-containing protein [Bordetella bronchiseptica]